MDGDFVADFPALDLRADRPDHAGSIRAGNVEGMLVSVQRRHRDAEPGPNAVIVDAAGHDIDQHLVLGDRPRGNDFALHCRFGGPVAILADRPGVHLRRHVTERRNFADLVEILERHG